MSNLTFPFGEAPAPGASIAIAPGLHWARMPLPMAGLDHINVWLLADGDGVCVVDTGLNLPPAREAWETLLAGRRVTRVIATHFHADHMGLAGWLTARDGAPLYMTRTDYFYGRILGLDIRDEPPAEFQAFYRRIGFDEERLAKYRARGFSGFASVVSPVPPCFTRIKEGDELAIGETRWRILVGSGHTPEHACLYAPELGLMIAGDQILPRISSNVSVHPTEPEANPLEDWLASLARFRDALPAETLILPAHNEPFTGVHHRLDRLVAGHHRRLEMLVETLDRPTPLLDLLTPVFNRPLKGIDLILAIGEILAHLHCLRGRGRVLRENGPDGIDYWRRSPSEETGRASS